MAPNPKVVKAFKAMKELGISEEKVKPILKKLLKLYDKNWDLIEAENYRALADAIFDSEETQAIDAAESKKKPDRTEPTMEEEAEEQDEPERPLKRLRLKYQGQASLSSNNSDHLAGTSLIIPKDEPIELPAVHPQRQLQSRVGSAPTHDGTRSSTESQHLSHESFDRSNGKQPVSPKSLTIHDRTGTVPHQISLRSRRMEAPSQDASLEKRLDLGRSSHAVSKEKTVSVQILVQPKEEPTTCDAPVPLAVIHPERLNRGDSSRENSSIEEPQASSERPLVLEYPGGESVRDGIPGLSSMTRMNSQLPTVPNGSSSQLQVASSPLGEVNISLSCNISPERPGFHPPSLDAVVKMVEDRCLRSYKFLEPNFSVMKLMKDMCECFLELGSESCSESEGNMQMSPRNDILRELPSGNPIVGEGVHFHIPDGICNALPEAEMGLPKALPLHIPCNGIYDSSLPYQAASYCNRVHEDAKQNNPDEANSRSLVVSQQHELTPDQIRYLHDVIDISKGQERVVISLINEINSECLPSFHYIPQNAVFQNAYMNFSLARIGDDNCCSTCCGDCLSLSTPCACAHETGGEFGYTVAGLVKEEFLNECVSMNRKPEKHKQYFCKECPLERSKNEDIIEPCKGHLVRKFIKECWWKCGCTIQCGNRVVQRGISHNLQVFMTERKGWGLRTLEDLPKGAFVCEYVGEVLTNAELFDRISRSQKDEVHSYPVLLDADWSCEGVLKDEEALCLDATHYGNVARFINHRCFDSNMVEIPVEVETPDHHYYHLAFFTTKKVKAMEELTWDYGIDFDDVDHPVKAFSCHCGSKYCRNIRRPSRSRSSLRR